MADVSRNEIIKMLMNNNFKGINISGLNLCDLDLSGLDFTNSKIQNSNLNNSNLSNAIFTGASLTSCTIKNTCFNGANFDDSIFDKLQIEFIQNNRSDLENFKVSKISNATFNNCEFIGRIINTRTYEILPKFPTDFHGCKFIKSDFIELKLSDFWSCKFRDVEFINSTLHDFYNSTFVDIEFTNSNGNYRNFGGSSHLFGESGFYGCNLNFVKFCGSEEYPFYLKSDFQHLESLTDLRFENVFIEKDYLINLRANSTQPNIIEAFKQYKVGRIGKVGGHYQLEYV